jgi:hypothetical protein
LRDLDRDGGWALLVEGVEQSYVDVRDPTYLEFEYMQHIALVLDVVFADGVAVDAVHLGGGAMTMPRWLAATRPGSRQVVLESAADVLAATSALPPVADCDVLVGDAMEGIAALVPASYDVVIWDLYDGPRAVTSSLTLEAVEAMAGLLRGGGVLLLNVSDVMPFEVVRPVLAALQQWLSDTALLAEPTTLRGRRSGNCVLVGTVGQRLPIAALRRVSAAAPVRARVLAGAGLQEFVGDVAPATAAAPLPLPDESLGRGFL